VKMLVKVDRVPGLGYFATAWLADGGLLVPTSKEDGPTTHVMSYWADSLKAINDEKAKVEALGHECDIIHVLA